MNLKWLRRRLFLWELNKEIKEYNAKAFFKSVNDEAGYDLLHVHIGDEFCDIEVYGHYNYADRRNIIRKIIKEVKMKVVKEECKHGRDCQCVNGNRTGILR